MLDKQNKKHTFPGFSNTAKNTRQATEKFQVSDFYVQSQVCQHAWYQEDQGLIHLTYF